MKDFSESFYDVLNNFLIDYCEDCSDFVELKEKISDIEIKF